jgi:peptidoglycan/xylan/chitin deacetylase (PgdA/CDA1 family)
MTPHAAMHRCTMLMYHVIDAARSRSEAMFCCPPARFREQLSWLARTGHTIISLSRLLEHLDGGPHMPNRSVVITIDDGIACSFENALPILAELDMPATVFVVADLLGKDTAWLQDTDLPVRRMMSLDQLRAMARANVEIGSHTSTHARLDLCSATALHAELVDSKARLEDLLGQPVRHFAYPYGRQDARVKSVVIDAGYESACSTIAGKNGADTDRFLLRRVEVFGSDAFWQFKGKVRLGTRDMPPLSLGKQIVKRALAHLSHRPGPGHRPSD